MHTNHDVCKKQQRTEESKGWLYALGFWVIAGSTYYLAPHLILYKPIVQNITNAWVPIIPITAAMYLTLYFQVIACFLNAEMYGSSLVFKYTCKAYFWCIVIAAIYYVCLPTMIVHPPIHGEDIFSTLLREVKKADVLYNAFPSTHTAYSMLGPLYFYYLGYKSDRMSRNGKWLLVWGILITASTLTTGQHHILDVIGGLMLAWGLAFSFARLTVLRETQRIRQLRALVEEQREARLLQI